LAGSLPLATVAGLGVKRLIHQMQERRIAGLGGELLGEPF